MNILSSDCFRVMKKKKRLDCICKIDIGGRDSLTIQPLSIQYTCGLLSVESLSLYLSQETC